ncbi:MAG: alkaline phosphatase family protein [Acidobacteriota bacterium]|jgi:predicted AlkP superfamily pyrophosphatase or phosphodiesterase
MDTFDRLPQPLSCARDGLLSFAARPATCLVAIALSLTLVGCGPRTPDEPSTGEATTAGVDAPLLLVISVDQMREDYLERFDAQFTGGFRRLLDQGAVFTEARQGQAITATAPGHAAILSGLYPRDHGIIDNTWYDHELGRRERASSDPAYRFIGLDEPDDGPGGAPTQFLGSSLVGWLKQHDPRSQAVSISRKDRTAVLLAPEAEHVYWWHATGRFISSTYYREQLPAWVRQFNDADWLSAYAGGSWELSRPQEAYAGARPDDYEGERGPRGFGNVFPHPLPEDRRALASRIQSTPFMDQATLELGRLAVTTLDLGGDEVPDVLALGLSSTDAIGHNFGPYSREIADQMLRLDGLLGDFFDFIDETVGLDRTLIVLTSDHGVVRLPEYSRELGEDAERLRMGEVTAGIDALIAPDFGGEDWFASYSYGWLQLDREQAIKAGADPQELIVAARDYVASLPYVAAVFTRDELMSDAWLDSPYVQSARHSFYADRSGDLYVVHQPLDLWEVGSAANHQSPHDYDQHVPLILMHPAVAAGARGEPVMLVDLAPTLATLLGVDAPGDLAGTVLPGFTP